MDPCQLPLHAITDVIIPGAMIPGNSSYVSGNPLANSLRKIFLSLVRLVSNFNCPFFEQTKQDANGSYLATTFSVSSRPLSPRRPPPPGVIPSCTDSKQRLGVGSSALPISPGILPRDFVVSLIVVVVVSLSLVGCLNILFFDYY
jgi:hypothetical protein